MNEGLNKFYNELSNWYDLMYLAQGVKITSSNPEVVSAFHWLIGKKRAKSVLDVACGTGDPLIGLFKNDGRGYSLFGSDGSQGMLRKCKENAKREGIRVTSKASERSGGLPLIHCAWKDLKEKFRDNQFDFVMCRGHGFYHLTTRDVFFFFETLRSFAFVTAKGGWILFDTLYWEYDASNSACGERGRDLAKWRGTVNFMANPHLRKYLPSYVYPDDINKAYFVDFTDYRKDPAAVGGVIQTKTLVAFGEKTNGKVEQIGHCCASGAAFSPEEGMQLMIAGLKDVQQVQSAQFNELKRYVILMGRKR